ncbi:olfactory receptor 5M5-like [Muntiacus reevesi]|uniref:olfactory receptor 5M5-like n=1 Tax=Muntiacus reevesi TaxID=9886 RepID=UPI003307579A
MFKENYTEVTEFILVGLTDRAELQPVLFAIFLVIYLITVFGNVSMILLIRADSKLQTPMYFFLSHLSFVDLCYATTVTPQMLVNLLSERKTISFLGCFIQFNFFISLGITDYYMLTVMAYDRYMAICKPLLYGSKMSRGVCVSLVAAPYIYGFANGLAQTILMLRLSFCGPKEINHFYCADPPLLVLACSDTYVKETAMFVVAGSNLTCSLTIILISYVFIFRAILRIRSAEGRRKAFSTCGSHLTAVTVFYGTLFCMYLRPPSKTSVEQGKVVAVFYIFVSPLLNPFIYSLRNKDVKRVIKKVIQEKLFVKPDNHDGMITQLDPDTLECEVKQTSESITIITMNELVEVMESQKMPLTNDTVLREFILLGLMDLPELQSLLFVLFLVVYLATALGNLGTMVLIRLDSRFPTPMYFSLTLLIRLACSQTHVKGLALLVSAGFNLCHSLIIILVSYAFILATILRIKSAEGRCKAFSICGST